MITDGAVTSAKILDGTIVDADVNASAAISGSKISPNFGSQTITTSGDITMSGTGALQVASGTTAQRPTAATGLIRYNSTIGCLETYVQSAWQVIANTSLDYGLITSMANSTFDYGALV